MERNGTLRKLAAKEEKEWNNRLVQHSKLRLYRILKSKLRLESYLLTLPRKIRQVFTQFRCGTNDLRIETGRWSKEAVEDRKCCLCGGEEIEDEMHVLLDCWVYNQLRTEMYARIRNITGDQYRLDLNGDDRQWMMRTLIGENIIDLDHRKRTQVVVANYLCKAMKRRKMLMDATD